MEIWLSAVSAIARKAVLINVDDAMGQPARRLAHSIDDLSIFQWIWEGCTTLTGMDRSPMEQAAFLREVIPLGRPKVFRGLVRQWSAVMSSGTPTSLIDYLSAYAVSKLVGLSSVPRAAAGRFFYNDSMTGLNFVKRRMPFRAALDTLLHFESNEQFGASAIQSILVDEYLPGFTDANRLLMLPDFVKPRAWIGNRSVVAAHYDVAENLACVVSGRRRFTIFPPEQVANLYPGPFEVTPAGVVVSMVDFDNPNYHAYPRFKKALEAATVVDLHPGDAIYIPYLWWHHVRSLDPVNMLVNYWWEPESATISTPMDALRHAMVALKGLPEHHRDAWYAMFAHFVFQQNGPVGEHIPSDRRGIQGVLDKKALRAVFNALRIDKLYSQRQNGATVA